MRKMEETRKDVEDGRIGSCGTCLSIRIEEAQFLFISHPLIPFSLSLSPQRVKRADSVSVTARGEMRTMGREGRRETEGERRETKERRILSPFTYFRSVTGSI